MASDNGNTDREIILADFQACTGIDNIAEAIALLELNNWDLVAAINVVIPQENGILQSNLPSEASESGSLFRPLAPMPPSVSTSTSTSTSPPSPPCPVRAARHALEHPRQPRMLSFRVEYRQRSVEVVLDEASTVGEIKQVLETELQIPASKLQLKGWKTGDMSDSTVLSSLHLPKNNSLYVLTPDIAPSASTSEARTSEEALSQNFVLVVNHQETGRDYSLNFPGDRTIQEVKRNISDVTNIPVRHQQWEGWPVTATDDQMTLASSGISYPCHRLRVSRRSPTPTSAQVAQIAQAAQAEQVSDIHMASDSEGDDFEDASEFGVDEAEIFGMGISGSRKSPMIPDDAENEDEALLHFTSEFKSRYGDLHPVFFIGSLESALQDAFYGKARDRKLLSIYLHHDESVLANVFCSQMLCAESVVSYLSQNFVTWAWDVTKEANKSRLLTMCTRHFGSMVTQAIRTQKTDNFPLFLIIMGKRASNEVLNVIQGILFAWNYTVDDLHVGRLLGNTTVGKLRVCLSLGNTTVDELMMRLMGAMEIFTAQQQEDIKDEAEREAREMVKREQDEAYRLSLEADRRKREAQEKEEAELSRLEQVRREQEQEREAIRMSLEQALPPEPEEEDDQPISKLRIRTPSGDFLERRFLASCRLQVLFDFVASKGYPCDEFKVITTYPRRNITDLDPSWTLLDAKLFPQETLFLEAKE